MQVEYQRYLRSKVLFFRRFIHLQMVGIVDPWTCTNEDVKTYMRGNMHRVSHILEASRKRRSLFSLSLRPRRVYAKRNVTYQFLRSLLIWIISYKTTFFFSPKGVYNFGVEVLALSTLRTAVAQVGPRDTRSHFRSQSVRNEVTKLANRSRNASRRVYNPHFCLLFFFRKNSNNRPNII